MAITRISEFTFAFAFLFEQTERSWSDLVAAPVLPSLKQEEDEGWDAKLPKKGVEFYYQFKLSDYLWASHAKYRRPGPDKVYDDPYFRFALHRHNQNQQHQRLRALSSTKEHTYYVAPEMPDLEAFNDVFLSRQIATSSRLVPLTKCKDYFDGEQHFITYQQGSTDFVEHSEPERKSGSARGAELEALYRRTAKSWRSIDEQYASRLLDITRTTIEREVTARERPRTLRDRIEKESVLRVIEEQPTRRSRQGYIKRAAELTSLYFGATLTLVGSPQDAS